MEELGTLERNLLAALAEADEPTESDRERVRGLVLQRVATAAGIAAATWAAGTSGAASNVATASSVAATSAATGAAVGGATTGAGATAAATSAVTTGAVAVWKGAIAAKIVAVAVGAGLAGGAGWYAVQASTSPNHVSTPSHAAPLVVERAPVTAAPAAMPAGAPQAQNAIVEPEAAKPVTDTTAAHRAVAARADRLSDRLGAEADLLKRAQQAINSGDNATALALAQEHAAKYPNGVLVQERIGLQAITLCRTGAHEQGVAAANRFLKANPSSPLSDRVRSSCDLTNR